MLACAYTRHGIFGGKPTVQRVPLPPAPGPGELLVRVFAASLNPADYKSADGEQAALLAFDWPRVVGFDFSGEVAAVGQPDEGDGDAGADADDVLAAAAFAVGDAVFGMIRCLPQAHRGTCAEFALVPAAVCARKPPGVAHFEAASLPLVAITAVKALRSCGLREKKQQTHTQQPAQEQRGDDGSAAAAGPRVLITGGAGGVGTAAIQLAKSLFGASYVATY